jgi:hypothetical protein
MAVTGNRLVVALADRAEAARYVDLVLLAVGRSLAVAQEFEQHARFVTWAAHAAARVADTENDGADAGVEDEGVGAAIEGLWRILTGTPYPRLIGPALGTLTALGVFDAPYLDVLKRAKDARNAIAHEGALLPTTSREALARHATKLISWVDDINAADIPLAKHAHDVEEPRDPLPLLNFRQTATARRDVLVQGLAPLLQWIPAEDAGP